MNKTALTLSAVTAFLIGMGASLTAVIVEAKGNLPSAASWLVIVFGALAVAAKDVRSLMKLPPVNETNGNDTKSITRSASRLPLVLLGGLLTGLLLTTGMSCRRLDPSADPIVVRTEQALEMGRATFLFTLQVNDKDRDFFRARTPEFHAFCETLRRPTPYPLTSTNLLPQWRVWLLSVDDVKRDYKAGRATGDAVLTSLSVLNGLLEQAEAWNTVITNRIKP